MNWRAWRAVVLGVLVLVVGLAACGGDDDDASEGDGSSVLRILVTNDDGVAGEGIDALVTGLEGLPEVEVTVVAPAEDRSGTGNTVSDDPPPGTQATLLSGHPAVAVAGFPADAVLFALDEYLDERPHVVVSGVNRGQNLGPVVFASGTVGAARAAAFRGIPALAVSQELREPVDYATGVELAVEWVEDHRDELLDGDLTTETVANLNVPSCTSGEVRGVVEVPRAMEGAERVFNPSDCTSSATHPADDVEAFLTGYASLSEIPVDDPG